MEGCSFLRAFEIKRYIKRYVKMPYKRVSLSTGALLGNLDGTSLLGLFEEKESLCGFLSWTQWTLRFSVWGPSGTLVKGQGSPELLSDCGAKTACL